MMEDPECQDANANQPWLTAFAITGYQTQRKSRPYRPSHKAKRGLDPIYEDVYSYNSEGNGVNTNSRSNSDSNSAQRNGRTNPGFSHDYEEVNEIECGQFVSGKKRSYSMTAARRHSPVSQMMNDLMTARIQARRKTEPDNQVIQTADWKSADFKANRTGRTDLKRAKSSIYHKCPAERKLEKRGFLVLFVIIVIFVFVVIAFMIDRWVVVKVDGDNTQFTLKNNNVTRD